MLSTRDSGSRSAMIIGIHQTSILCSLQFDEQLINSSNTSVYVYIYNTQRMCIYVYTVARKCTDTRRITVFILSNFNHLLIKFYCFISTFMKSLELIFLGLKDRRLIEERKKIRVHACQYFLLWTLPYERRTFI